MKIEFPTVDAPSDAIRNGLAIALMKHAAGRGLGRLGEIGAWLASVQNSTTPQPFVQASCVLVAGNHGIAARGISAHASDHAWTQVKQVAAGGGMLCAAAKQCGATVVQVNDYLALATGCIDVEPAMSPETAQAAMLQGTQLADQLVDGGADLLIPADVAVANSTVAAAVYGALSKTEPVKVIGRGSGIDDEVWKQKVAVIRDAMFRVRAFSEEIDRVLAEISGPDFAFLVGFIAQAAVRRTPILIDGVYVTVAAYVAERLAPGTKRWLIAGQLSPEPAHIQCLQAMDLVPVLALDMSFGQGIGALAALPQINLAATLVTLAVEDAA